MLIAVMMGKSRKGGGDVGDDERREVEVEIV